VEAGEDASSWSCWQKLTWHIHAYRLRAFKRRQYQAHSCSLAAALPCELAAELLGEALDRNWYVWTAPCWQVDF